MTSEDVVMRVDVYDEVVAALGELEGVRLALSQPPLRGQPLSWHTRIVAALQRLQDTLETLEADRHCEGGGPVR
jgi:hypothetical protein